MASDDDLIHHLQCKVQGHHTKVKGKQIAYHCTWNFIVSSLIPKQFKSDKICK